MRDAGVRGIREGTEDHGRVLFFSQRRLDKRPPREVAVAEGDEEEREEEEEDDEAEGHGNDFDDFEGPRERGDLDDDAEETGDRVGVGEDASPYEAVGAVGDDDEEIENELDDEVEEEAVAVNDDDDDDEADPDLVAAYFLPLRCANPTAFFSKSNTE